MDLEPAAHDRYPGGNGHNDPSDIMRILARLGRELRDPGKTGRPKVHERPPAASPTGSATRWLPHAGWKELPIDLGDFLAFLGSQFVVFGLILCGANLDGLARSASWL